MQNTRPTFVGLSGRSRGGLYGLASRDCPIEQLEDSSTLCRGKFYELNPCAASVTVANASPEAGEPAGWSNAMQGKDTSTIWSCSNLASAAKDSPSRETSSKRPCQFFVPRAMSMCILVRYRGELRRSSGRGAVALTDIRLPVNIVSAAETFRKVTKVIDLLRAQDTPWERKRGTEVTLAKHPH